MAIAVVAPVPSKHLESAMAAAVLGRAVAFGSNKLEVFQDDMGNLKITLGTRVLIYGSTEAKTTSRWHIPARATVEGIFVGWEKFDSGFYEGKAARPETTTTNAPTKDTPFFGFWVVSDLTAINGGFPLSNLRLNASGRKIALPPRYPVIVDLPA